MRESRSSVAMITPWSRPPPMNTTVTSDVARRVAGEAVVLHALDLRLALLIEQRHLYVLHARLVVGLTDDAARDHVHHAAVQDTDFAHDAASAGSFGFQSFHGFSIGAGALTALGSAFLALRSLGSGRNASGSVIVSVVFSPLSS